MEQLCSALLTSVTLLLEACLVCLLVAEVAWLLLVTEDEDDTEEDTEDDLMVDTELELLTVRCNAHNKSHLSMYRVHQS